MRFAVLDVGHGVCAYAVAQNGQVVLFDCGHKEDPEFRPSVYFQRRGIRAITRFVVTNYDQDHISDLPTLRERVDIHVLRRNKSVTPEVLRALKEETGPITPAMRSMLEMMARYTGGPPQPPPEFPGIQSASFENDYPDFEDTNNLSLVSFLDVAGKRFLIPGDLERPGWTALLEDPRFVRCLRGARVLLASHHGRESGYCPEIFDFAVNVEVVVMSDGPVQHASQEMVSEYARHASGVMFNGELRRILTTRNDGSLYWEF